MGGDSLDDTMSEQNRIMLTILGIACMLVGTMIALPALRGDAGSAAFAVVCLLLIFLGGAAALIHCKLFRKRDFTLAAISLLYMALCIRCCLMDHISADYVSFLSQWTERMRNLSLREAMTTPIGDYNMPYLYLLLLISRLPFYDLYAIKLFSILADVACALAVGKLIRTLEKPDKLVFFGFTAALFAPTVWLNSAYWGQCDGIYTAFALWGLYAGLRKRPGACMALLALSLTFKLQAVFLLPIILFLLAGGYISVKHIPVFPGAFLAAMLPALLCGRSVHDTFSIYVDQTGAYPYLSLNAPSFWSMIHNGYFEDFSAASVLLAGTAVLLIIYILLPGLRRGDKAGIMEVALILSLMIPWLLPKMHERYFYLAEILSIVYAAAYPKRFPVAIGLLLGGFLIYCPYLFGEMPILSLRMVAAVYGLILVYLFLRCQQKHNHDITIQNGGNANGT